MIEKLDSLTREYIARHGRDCALGAPCKRQYVWMISILTAAVFLLFYRWDFFLCAITAFSCIFYGGTIAFRTVAMLLSLSGKGEIKISDEEAAGLKNKELPIYTILLPLYREEAIVKKLIDNLGNLDYPKNKLDIKLLLEEDDTQTRSVLEKEKLPKHYEVIVIPHNEPKTKPRACNYGLAAARGEFCVIFDAEDHPEPDQLRKVVKAFRQNDEKLACIQAKLNYYNHDQNLLTKLFTIEYSTTFDLFLPGLKRMRVPVPLGGTSNHFRTKILQEIARLGPVQRDGRLRSRGEDLQKRSCDRHDKFHNLGGSQFPYLELGQTAFALGERLYSDSFCPYRKSISKLETSGIVGIFRILSKCRSQFINAPPQPFFLGGRAALYCFIRVWTGGRRSGRGITDRAAFPGVQRINSCFRFRRPFGLADDIHWRRTIHVLFAFVYIVLYHKCYIISG